jgi:3-deoxy-manno-octulosonate cytidylyltransferase (CMP-KDO synthetase)
MKIIAIIPARMAATRFPGKPLAKILGLPMIEHVRRRVALCPLIDEVIVATCDEEILKATQSYGGKAVMTSNVYQGDEPLLRPDLLELLVAPLLADASILCTNLMSPITREEAANPNLVKVVCDLQGNALYYSRDPIPSPKKAGSLPLHYFRQLGIYGFTKSFLSQYRALSPTPLEAVESVDMLRAVEHGIRVRMVVAEFSGVSVDIPEELAQATALVQADPLTQRYMGVK